MKKGFIYKITSPSGRVYIGQTINFKKRMDEYKGYDTPKSPVKVQRKLYNSFKKYGFDSHIKEIISEYDQGLNNSILDEMEIYWINEYNSYTNGLNCTKGGQGTAGRIHSKETREKISNTHKLIQSGKGRIFSEETRRKMSNSRRGIHRTEITKIKIGLGNKGKKMSETQKHKLSQSLSNRNLSDEHKKKIGRFNLGKKSKIRKEIYCSNGEVYEHLKDASNKLSISMSTISRVCNGKISSHNGFIFRYSIDSKI